MAYVYRHIRLDKNEPFYIGIGEGRSFQRAYEKTNRNKYWKNIILKSDYDVEILFSDIPRKFAIEKEKEFINLYGRKDLNTGSLVNLTTGGECNDFMKGKKQSKDHIEKRAKVHRGKKVSLETREKLRLINIGKKQSKETINKRVEKLIGQKRKFKNSELRNSRISESLRGRKLPQETIEKMRKRMIGVKNRLGMKNKKYTNDKISNSNSKFTYIIETPSKEIIEIKNLHKFSIDNNLNGNFIYTIRGKDLNGKTINHCKGFRILSKTQLSKNTQQPQPVAA